MTRIAAGDLERALTLSGELHAARSSDELHALALRGLGRLVRADAVGWNEIDLRTGANRFLGEPADYMSDDDLAVLDRLIAQHPIVGYYSTTADGSPVTISDFVGVRAYRSGELYADLFRSKRVEDQLAVAIEAGGHVTGIAFSRDSRSFSARDRAVLDLLRPHLVSANTNLRALEAAHERLERLERSLEEDGRGVAVVRDGRIEPLTAAAAAILRRWFGGEQPPVPENGQPLVLESPDRRLTLRRATCDATLLLLDETSFAPPPDRARELGLNVRETEVLALAARGLANAAIAGELFVSVRTVEKHLENAYRKLGVHSRDEAVARLFGP